MKTANTPGNQGKKLIQNIPACGRETEIGALCQHGRIGLSPSSRRHRGLAPFLEVDIRFVLAVPFKDPLTRAGELIGQGNDLLKYGLGAVFDKKLTLPSPEGDRILRQRKVSLALTPEPSARGL